MIYYHIGILSKAYNNETIAMITLIFNNDKTPGVLEFNFFDPIIRTRYCDDTRILGSGCLEHIRFRRTLRESSHIMGRLLGYNVKINH
jgi:hypothetical protein